MCVCGGVGGERRVFWGGGGWGGGGEEEACTQKSDNLTLPLRLELLFMKQRNVTPLLLNHSGGVTVALKKTQQAPNHLRF